MSKQEGREEPNSRGPPFPLANSRVLHPPPASAPHLGVHPKMFKLEFSR